MPKKKYKRKKYIVDPEFQYGVIRRITILALLIVLMSFTFLSIVHYRFGDVKVEVSQPDPFSKSGIFTSSDKPKTLVQLLWPVMAVCLGGTLIVNFIFGMIMSHRMAGPVYRIKKKINKMAEGDFRGELKLREKDDFQSLAERINNLNLELQGMVFSLRDFGTSIRSESSIPDEYAGNLSELLDKYKTS